MRMAITAQFAFVDLTTGCSWLSRLPHVHMQPSTLLARRRGRTSGFFPAKLGQLSDPLPHPCSVLVFFGPCARYHSCPSTATSGELAPRATGTIVLPNAGCDNTTLAVSACWLKGRLRGLSNATMPALSKCSLLLSASPTLPRGLRE